jgi:glycosyltransferase involved in cell wall biosynthesis
VSADSRTRILYVARDYWACGWYRCYVPGVELKRLGYEVHLDNNVRPDDAENYDVIVVQSPSEPQHLELIERGNEAGVLTVAEMDDDVWAIGPAHPGLAYWGRPDMRRNARVCIERSQLVTTPSIALAEKLRAMNPRVTVIPNVLPVEGWEYPEPKVQREDKVVLGWAGSTSHIGDVRMIDDVVQQLLERYPYAEMAFAGGPPEPELTPHPRIRRLPATDIQHYPKLLEEFDIGLAPLADTAFNASKSDLKFVEYSMLGIPSVVSKLEPFLRTVKQGENGFLAASAKDWLKHLGRLIENVELRRSIGARAQEYARTRSIVRTIGRWERAYGLTRSDATAGGEE